MESCFVNNQIRDDTKGIMFREALHQLEILQFCQYFGMINVEEMFFAEIKFPSRIVYYVFYSLFISDVTIYNLLLLN